MEKAYEPNKIESSVYEDWENASCFKPTGKGSPISVVIPPPNVTGVLHLGHALNLTLQDMLVRKYRLSGYDVCWIPGTDHAGIATQNVVEKQLRKQNVSRQSLGRKGFVDKVWEWKHEFGERITNQVRKLGASVDWSRERFTMDEGCHDAVLETFVDLYNKDLIYRGEYIINWCPRCETALSDIEVEHEDAKGSLWHIKYPVVNSKTNESIVIATTRPETLFGDTAIAVYPSDKRYKHLIGTHVHLPLTNRTIPIIADAHVDPEFGSGAVKVTPAHDANDYAIGDRHSLERIKIMDQTGKMNENSPDVYQGMDRFDCRKQLVDDLEKQGFLEKIEDHQLSRGHCYRCHTVIEPYLSKQWFVAMKKMAKAGIDVIKTGDIKFTPSRWEKIYFDWMGDIRDWCISRQIWWGHRIPVFYCDSCDDPIVQKVAPTACPNCKGITITQDEDVLDTWFSSALWPFETFGWPKQNHDLKKYYPTTFLITGYDIITFWVSRMIVMGLEQMKQIPFKDVYIHGLIRDSKGKKMSKSVGNAVDPLQLVDEYGADALRWSLASSATLGGQDIRYTEEKVRSCRNFMNKIWNASRYILMIVEQHPVEKWVDEDGIEDAATSIGDQWILSEFYTMLDKVNDGYEAKNFALVCDLLWDFIWNKFCDWYVEMSKFNKQSSVQVLGFLLVRILQCIHPIAPFISETLWSTLKVAGFNHLGERLIQDSWPKSMPNLKNEAIEGQMILILELIRETRHIKKQLNISPAKDIELIIEAANEMSLEALNWGKDILGFLANASQITFESSLKERPKQAVSSVVQSVQLFIPLKGLVDIDKEISRLSKQVAKIDIELARANGKLSNQGFLGKAPENVVEKIRQAASSLQEEKSLLEKQLAGLA